MSANQQEYQQATPVLPRLTGLTVKQRRFVEAYCGPARGNGMEAAKLAGYNASDDNSFAVIGAENLIKLKREISDRLDALSMDKGEILAELSDIGRSPWRDHVEVVLDPKTGATIDAKLRLADKVKSLDILSKIRRMQGPETQVNVQINVGPEVLERAVQAAPAGVDAGEYRRLCEAALIELRPDLAGVFSQEGEE